MGTAAPRREFFHVDDLADASVFILNLDDKTLSNHLLPKPKPSFVNVSSGVDCTILELADAMKEIVGFSGNLIFDRSKPNGAPQKLLDVYRINHMGWRYQISLAKEICDVYTWYQSQTKTEVF